MKQSELQNFINEQNKRAEDLIKLFARREEQEDSQEEMKDIVADYWCVVFEEFREFSYKALLIAGKRTQAEIKALIIYLAYDTKWLEKCEDHCYSDVWNKDIGDIKYIPLTKEKYDQYLEVVHPDFDARYSYESYGYKTIDHEDWIKYTLYHTYHFHDDRKMIEKYMNKWNYTEYLSQQKVKEEKQKLEDQLQHEKLKTFIKELKPSTRTGVNLEISFNLINDKRDGYTQYTYKNKDIKVFASVLEELITLIDNGEAFLD